MKKLKSLLRRWKKNTGFTLVELVVSCGLLGILVVGVTAFIAPVLRSAAENEKNVRATLLAQTIDEFVSRSTRDAYYVAIFTDAKRADVNDGGSIATNANLLAMKDFVDQNSSIYELKCFSYSWSEDTQSHEHKYMLMTEQFKSASTALENNPVPVFENCFYDGLFPEITVESIMVKKGSSDSSEESTESGEPANEVAAAIKSTYTIYTKQEMTHEEFVGVGYTEFCNVRADSDENKTKKFKFYPIENMASGEEHPSTFIYYVARKPSRFDVTSTTP
ncbi:MAG: prepilin-type N-terminal cleavage/methylation domain-containing protein [Oscillospiraceae bacterium]|nr:prepilin-type N-terminal cleavage/methylation domain-containing protein [Oscillospiraceae bacterium]